MIDLLKVEELRSGYGDLEIIHSVSFEVKDGETVVLLALNGAGKTTLLRTIMGLNRISSGKVLVDGADVTHLPTHMRAKHGLTFVGEQSIIPTLTVRENLDVAAFNFSRHDARQRIDDAVEMFPELRDQMKKRAGSLSGGQRKFLSFAMALAAKTKILLLDEPSLGLSPVLVDRVIDALKEMKNQGTTMLLAEQNAGFTELADRVMMLELGEIRFVGDTDQAMKNDQLASLFFNL